MFKKMRYGEFSYKENKNILRINELFLCFEEKIWIKNYYGNVLNIVCLKLQFNL